MKELQLLRMVTKSRKQDEAFKPELAELREYS